MNDSKLVHGVVTRLKVLYRHAIHQQYSNSYMHVTMKKYMVCMDNYLVKNESILYSLYDMLKCRK